jgi:hypothetical protein
MLMSADLSKAQAAFRQASAQRKILLGAPFACVTATTVLALLVQKYLLYWDKSTSARRKLRTDASWDKSTSARRKLPSRTRQHVVLRNMLLHPNRQYLSKTQVAF